MRTELSRAPELIKELEGLLAKHQASPATDVMDELRLALESARGQLAESKERLRVALDDIDQALAKLVQLTSPPGVRERPADDAYVASLAGALTPHLERDAEISSLLRQSLSGKVERRKGRGTIHIVSLATPELAHEMIEALIRARRLSGRYTSATLAIDALESQLKSKSRVAVRKTSSPGGRGTSRAARAGK
jgi:hypothetical protein